MIAANLAFSALVLASVYTLVNVGFVLLYRTTGVINFAQGDFMLLSAYFMSALPVGLPYGVRLVIVAVALWAIAVVIYLLLMRFLLGAPEFTKVITTLMLGTILLQIPSVVWGPGERFVPPPTLAAVYLGSLRLEVSNLVIIGEAIVVVGALTFVVHRTVAGVRMRAIANNETLAAYAGIRVHRLAAFAWGLAGAGAAIAGVAYAQTSGVSLSIPDVALSAFPAVVIGGMDSVGGALLGGLVVAAIQTVTTYELGAIYGDISSYLLMLIVLMIRPTGLFGSAQGRRL